MTPQEQLNLIREALAEVNGRRRTRTLHTNDVLAAIDRARTDGGKIKGVGMTSGGNVANAYGYRSYQTTCLVAMRTDGKMRIGLAVTFGSKGASLATCTTGLTMWATPAQFREWADECPNNGTQGIIIVDADLPEKLAHEAACQQNGFANDTPAEIINDYILEHA